MSYILGRSKPVARSFGFTAGEQPKSGEILTYGGDGHLVTFAPTGSGAGSTLAKRLLLSLPRALLGHTLIHQWKALN
jgi:hypothetical protein